jgi:hypothetical protein
MSVVIRGPRVINPNCPDPVAAFAMLRIGDVASASSGLNAAAIMIRASVAWRNTKWSKATDDGSAQCALSTATSSGARADSRDRNCAVCQRSRGVRSPPSTSRAGPSFVEPNAGITCASSASAPRVRVRMAPGSSIRTRGVRASATTEYGTFTSS